MECVLARLNKGPSSGRVLLHAAGFAGLLSMPLKVLHVTEADPHSVEQLLDFCVNQAPIRLI